MTEQEMLIIPRLSFLAEGFETEWVYNDIGRGVDRILRDDGRKLMKRRLTYDETMGAIEIEREYGLGENNHFSYARGIYLEDHEPEETIVTDGGIHVTRNSFLKNLASNTTGFDKIDISPIKIDEGDQFYFSFRRWADRNTGEVFEFYHPNEEKTREIEKTFDSVVGPITKEEFPMSPEKFYEVAKILISLKL